MLKGKLSLLVVCSLLCGFLAAAVFAQGGRGKAELNAGGGGITVDYGRPALKGRDMLSKLNVGSFWRMGANQATVLTTPADLTFGSTKIAKGSYSLFLKREAADTYHLVFNSQTGQWGTQHDVSKDVAGVPMKAQTVASPVEVLTIDLKPSSNGGTFVMTWGTTQLSADFAVAK